MSLEEGLARKEEAEKYVQIAASAAASGNFNRAERMLHIAENLYSTPLGKKILIDIQNARVENVPSSQAPSNKSEPSSESSNDSCDCSSSEECRQSPKSCSISSEEDFDGNVPRAAYHHQNRPQLNLNCFRDAVASLDQAEKYFAMHEVDLTNKSKMKPFKKKSFEYSIDDNETDGLDENPAGKYRMNPVTEYTDNDGPLGIDQNPAGKSRIKPVPEYTDNDGSLSIDENPAGKSRKKLVREYTVNDGLLGRYFEPEIPTLLSVKEGRKQRKHKPKCRQSHKGEELQLFSNVRELDKEP